MNENEENQMEEQTVEQLQDEVLRVVGEAAPHRIAIDTELADTKKLIVQQYVDMRIKSDYEIKSIWMRRKSDRSPEEKAQLKEFIKNAKREFKTLCSLLFPSNPMSNPLAALAQKVAMVVRMLRYIGCTGFDNVLAQNGMSVETRKLEEDSAFWDSDDSRELAKDVFRQAEAVAHRESDEKMQICEVKYQELPEEYIRTQDNPTGISVAQFAKLVKAKAVAMTVSSDDYTAYKDRLIERDANALESANTTLELTKTL